MAKEHEELSPEALAEDPWALASNNAAAGDRQEAGRWLLEGLNDVSATLAAGLNVLERARSFCDQQWGSQVWAEVTRRAPIDPALAARQHAERVLEQLRSAIDEFVAGGAGQDGPDSVDPRIEAAVAAAGQVHANVYDFVALVLTVVAETRGEDQVPTVWRAVLGDRSRVQAAQQRALPDRVRAMNRIFRAHFGGDIAVVDRGDRIEVTHSTCGTGGRMRREGGFGGTVEFGSTLAAHPWSWNRPQVPYYCVHCCLMWELDPVESGSGPVRIHEGMDDHSSSAVRHIYYKDGAELPAEYTERVRPDSR